MKVPSNGRSSLCDLFRCLGQLIGRLSVLRAAITSLPLNTSTVTRATATCYRCAIWKGT